MVAQPHDPAIRHNELLKAAQEIADLKIELQDMTNARNAQKMRADRAEMLNRQLEAQLKTDKREALTLIQDITMPEARTASDKEYADYRSQGWTPEDITISTIVGEVSTSFKRIVTLIRVAPLEPAHDQPPITTQATVHEVATVEPHDKPVPADQPDSSTAGLWNALYQMVRYAELVQHWPQLPQYAPRVYDVLAAAGCDMADVVIMKSFRMGHTDDKWTLKVIFRYISQIVPGIRKALAVAGFERVIAQNGGREFILDLPQSWVSPSPRKTITASSMTIIDETDQPAPAAESGSEVPDHRAEMMDVARNAYNTAMSRNPLPPYRQLSTSH